VRRTVATRTSRTRTARSRPSRSATGSSLSLLACSNGLSANSGEDSLDGKRLEQILTEARELADGVLEDALPDALKLFIRRHLQTLIDAIEEYPITGSLPIQDTLATTAGSLRLQPKEQRNILKKSAAWRTFVKIAGEILVLLNLAKTARDLLPFPSKPALLEPPAVERQSETPGVPALDLSDTSTTEA
jgi:hypothetical protein